MAEIRNSLSSSAITPVRPPAPQRVQAAREAQRAFFNAALAGDVAPSVAAADVPVKSVATATPTAAPDLRLRPGSIVDIKV